MNRIEKDFLGTVEIPENVFYGIHSKRATENFPDNTSFPIEWYKSMALVKLAFYQCYFSFKKTVLTKYKISPINLIDDKILETLIRAAEEVSKGKYIEHFIVPAIQGGAGTSINMNINEIIANVALYHNGFKPGMYEHIDPIEHANIYQSTNDVVPTALKVACLFLLNKLENKINELRISTESIEKLHRNELRIAYTQMQEAVPGSWDKLFSTYNDALSRDWWRVSKCVERIKTINLGGSAIGTSITVPVYFVMNLSDHLRSITGLPLSKSENLNDATNNLDSFVEIHGILKAHAVNLEKIVSDIRLLSSDIISKKELIIAQKQAGSSIMPGKVNPVIPEFVISIAHKIYSNDTLITSLCAQGCLDLNAYIPTIGYALIDSLKLLIAANESIQKHLINDLKINIDISSEKLFHSASITTALIPYIGYHKATELALEMKKENISIIEANKKLNFLDENKLNSILESGNLLQQGFSLDNIIL